MEIVSLEERTQDPAVVRLLAIAQIHLDPADAQERAPVIAAEYAEDASLSILGCEESGAVLGLVGVQHVGAAEAVVRDLAVDPRARRRHIGRRLIDHLRFNVGYQILHGHTLEQALDFYRACSFQVQPDGYLPTGAVTYSFRWHRDR
jgi:ribosomal protein S18 acetylase RimI-like enzyme